jgi:alpha-1,2-mannosyltransferase
MLLTPPTYLVVTRAILPRPETTLVALAFRPPLSISVMVRTASDGRAPGRKSASLDKRPIVAGVLIGLLAYKPQFGLLVPLVRVATGRWTVMVAAAATVAAACVARLLLFGLEV